MIDIEKIFLDTFNTKNLDKRKKLITPTPEALPPLPDLPSDLQFAQLKIASLTAELINRDFFNKQLQIENMHLTKTLNELERYTRNKLDEPYNLNMDTEEAIQRYMQLRFTLLDIHTKIIHETP